MSTPPADGGPPEFGGALLAGLLGASIVGLLAWLVAGWWWVADVLAQVPAFWVWIGGLGLVLAVSRRSRLGLPLALVTALQLGRWLLPALPTPTTADGPVLRVLVVNVYTGNRDHDAILALVDAADPDLVAFLEVDDRWAAALAPVAEGRPHQLVVPRSDNFGVAVFSRVPVDDLAVQQLAGAGVPSVVGTLPGDVRLLVTHPVPPVSATYAGWRDAQLAAIGRDLAEADGRWLLVGDLNATPWSAHFPVALWGGIPVGTWPSAAPLRIPIDHVLVGAGLTLVGREVGPAVGSDHRPVLADVRLP